MLKKVSQSIKEIGDRTWSGTTALLEAGRSLARKTVGAIPLFGSNEVSDSYDDIINDPKQHTGAGLGPEDVRWLNLIRQIASGDASLNTQMED